MLGSTPYKKNFQRASFQSHCLLTMLSYGSLYLHKIVACIQQSCYSYLQCRVQLSVALRICLRFECERAELERLKSAEQQHAIREAEAALAAQQQQQVPDTKYWLLNIGIV